MVKRLSVLLIAGASLIGLAAGAQQAVKPSQAPIRRTSVSSGQQMYMAYCAVCHGTTGAGDGPASTALKVRPTDLAALSRRNNNVFPENRVVSALKFGVENPAHGSADMPIWGNLLSSLHKGDANPDAPVTLRIANLTQYLRTMQR